MDLSYFWMKDLCLMDLDFARQQHLTSLSQTTKMEIDGLSLPNWCSDLVAFKLSHLVGYHWAPVVHMIKWSEENPMVTCYGVTQSCQDTTKHSQLPHATM